MITLVAAHLACSLGQSSPSTVNQTSTPNLVGLTPIHNYGSATPNIIIVTQSPYDGHQPLITPIPNSGYIRQDAIESSNLCVLSANPDGCIIVFNTTGVMTGINYQRASRELKWGYDFALDTVAALAFDPIDNRMEVFLLDNSMTEIRFEGGNVLGCTGAVNCWGSYSTTTGITLDEAPAYLEYLGMKLMADAIVDARALSAMGQLCYTESGKEISFLLPCHTAESTMIPTP